MGISGEDYCMIPPAGVLVLQGDADEQPDRFPLGVCEGHCRNDDDCQVSRGDSPRNDT